MKKLLALVLCASLVLSLAGCGSSPAPSTAEPTVSSTENQETTAASKEETPTTEKPTTKEPTTEAPTTEEPTTTTEEPSKEVDKQAFYEELFNTPEKLAFAGESVAMTMMQEGVLFSTVFESVGEDSSVGMFNAESGTGFSVIRTGDETLLYLAYADEESGKTEKLYSLKGEDAEGMDAPVTKPDLSFDESMKFEVEYLGEEDGEDLVNVKEITDDGSQEMVMRFNKDAKITGFSGEMEGQNVQAVFYDVEKVSIPGDGLEKEEADAATAGIAMFAVLMSMMGGGTDDPSGGSGLDTTVEYTLENEVLVDDENCSAVIAGCELDPIWGFNVTVAFDNKMTDKNLEFTMDNVVVNGYAMTSYWSKDVEAEGSDGAEFTLYDTSLLECGITSVDELSFRLEVKDADSWGADPVFAQNFTLYPSGLDKEDVVIPERRTTENELVAVDNEYCTVVILGEEEESIWGTAFDIYLENKTDMDLEFNSDAWKVNDVELDPWWGTEVPAGARYYSQVSFSDEKLDGAEIDKVEKLEFKITAKDASSWDSEDLFEETITYTP